MVVDVGVDSEGRRQQKWHGGFSTRRAAEVERAKIVSDLHSGGYVAPDRLTLAEWVRQSWLPMTKTRVKPSTFDSYRSNMETHVLPALGSRALQQLTAPMLNTLYAELLSHGGERGLDSVKGTRLEAAWRLAAMTGMRRGEALGLRWCDVDLDASRLAVRNAIVSVAYEGARVLAQEPPGAGY